MRLRNVPGAREAVAASPYCVREPFGQRGRWKELLPGARALHLEIGSGKGGFLIEQAAGQPDTLFIGMERSSTIIYKALQKLRDERPHDNLRFVLLDASLLHTAFAPGEVDRIYLNFSDPWPKERHAERRLTSRTFLMRYDEVLAPGGRIECKTDNRALFDWSLEQLAGSAFCHTALTYDLHADKALLAGNVMTEYETRFAGQGHPICKCIMERKQ